MGISEASAQRIESAIHEIRARLYAAVALGSADIDVEISVRARAPLAPVTLSLVKDIGEAVTPEAEESPSEPTQHHDGPESPTPEENR